MGAAPPSYEPERRRALRSAMGVTAALTLTQLFPWPLALITPAVTNLLLQDAKPMPLGKGARTILGCVAILGCGFIISLFLVNYPVVMVLSYGLLIALMFRFVMTTEEHLILFVAMIVGFTGLPVVTRLLPELAVIAMGGAMMCFVAGWVIAMLAFTLMPPLEETPPAHGHGEEELDVNGIAATLGVIVCTLLSVFLMFGLTKILVMIYTVLFATTVSTAGSSRMAVSYLKANLLFGGIAAILVFEILVIAPFLPLMIAVVFLTIYVFARYYFSHKPDAAIWSSGSFGFLLLIGGLLSSDKVIASAKVIDRVWQIGLAALYVTFAFAILEFVQRWRRSRSVVPHHG